MKTISKSIMPVRKEESIRKEGMCSFLVFFILRKPHTRLKFINIFLSSIFTFY